MIIYFHLFASSFMSVFQWIHDVDVWLFECKLHWIMWSCESVGKMLNYRFGSFDSINSAKNVLRTPDIHYHYQSMMKETEKWRENEKKNNFFEEIKKFWCELCKLNWSFIEFFFGCWQESYFLLWIWISLPTQICNQYGASLRLFSKYNLTEIVGISSEKRISNKFLIESVQPRQNPLLNQ